MVDPILIITGISVILGVVAGITWRREGRSLRKEFGLRGGWWALRDLGAGFLITFLGMLGIFLVELLLGQIRITGVSLNLSGLTGNLNLLIPGAIYEELFFRMLLLSGLVVVLGGRKWLAVLISAAVFGIVHLANPGASPITAFGNALGGVIYGMAFLGGKNIWLPLGLHFSWNFSQGPIFGFPVSGYPMGGLFVQERTGSDLLTGGAYGPEAGLIGMVFRLVIMAMVIYYLQRRSAGQGDPRTLEFPIQGYDSAEARRAARPRAA